MYKRQVSAEDWPANRSSQADVASRRVSHMSASVSVSRDSARPEAIRSRSSNSSPRAVAIGDAISCRCLTDRRSAAGRRVAEESRPAAPRTSTTNMRAVESGGRPAAALRLAEAAAGQLQRLVMGRPAKGALATLRAKRAMTADLSLTNWAPAEPRTCTAAPPPAGERRSEVARNLQPAALRLRGGKDGLYDPPSDRAVAAGPASEAPRIEPPRPAERRSPSRGGAGVRESSSRCAVRSCGDSLLAA